MGSVGLSGRILGFGVRPSVWRWTIRRFDRQVRRERTERLGRNYRGLDSVGRAGLGLVHGNAVGRVPVGRSDGSAGSAWRGVGVDAGWRMACREVWPSGSSSVSARTDGVTGCVGCVLRVGIGITARCFTVGAGGSGRGVDAVGAWFNDVRCGTDRGAPPEPRQADRITEAAAGHGLSVALPRVEIFDVRRCQA